MATKSIGPRTKKIEHVIDAKGQVLGRLATEIALILQGKTTPDYKPYLPGNNTVIVKNASKIKVTGKKETEKVYYRHTGYVGHLKEEKYSDLMNRRPTEIMRRAVYNMLPKNKLRQRRMNRLKIEA